MGAFAADGKSVLAADREFRKLLKAAAEEMPPAMPPRPPPPITAERREEKEKLDARLGVRVAQERRRADLAAISTSLRGVAAGLVVADGSPERAAAVRGEASRAEAWAGQDASKVDVRPSPVPPAPRPGRQRDRGGRG